jgi:pantoate--beta-alanine ligase
MQIINTAAEMNAIAQGQSLGLVPTMGNLHAGHLSLVEAVKPLADKTVVSIYVNPMQFGPNEDFASYPRTLEQDCEKLKQIGVDYVFAPTDLISHTFIKVPDLSDILCGASRPGHFQGVATIVCKLFHIVQPKLAIFGQKDFQQLQIIRRMVNDLSLPIDILSGQIIRESNGLAMSSRNQYLSDDQREQAAQIYQALTALAHQDYSARIQPLTEHLQSSGFKIDYLTVRRQEDLQEPNQNDKKLVAMAAAFLGKTRLIDNITFEVP